MQEYSGAASTALMVIDMQRDFCAPEGYAAQAGMDIVSLRRPIIAIQRLLAVARKRGLLVVHTREGHRADLSDCPPVKLARSRALGAAIGSKGPLGRLLIRGEYGHDIIDEVYPLEDEPIIDKPGYGAFHQTDLGLILDNAGIRRLVLTGVTTDVCVHSTLREAVDRGYVCTTVADACAASNPSVHTAALAMIGGEGGIFGAVCDSAEVLQDWKIGVRR